jgi:hypothetical protein
MTNIKTAAVLATAVIICLLSLVWSHQSNKYSISSIVELDSVRLSIERTGPAIQSAREFSEEIVNAYRQGLIAKVNPTFQNEFPLWAAKGVSAKFVFSSTAECLLYLFPDEQNVLYADLIQVPVQPPLMHGLIQLDAPLRAVSPGSLSMESIRRAAGGRGRPPGGIPAHGAISMLWGSESTKLTLTNGMQLIDFPYQNSLALVSKGTYVISNTADWYRDALGSAVSFSLILKGPLILSSEKELSWVADERKMPQKELGTWLGKQMAEHDVIDLLAKSQFFRQSLADPSLKPLAEAILSKQARAEKDPDFSYPIWQQDLDVRELRLAGEKLKIDGSYVDRLLGKKPAFPTGFLLGYFENAMEFMLQWIMINLVILVLLVIVYINGSYIPAPLKTFIVSVGVTMAIVAINWGWIFLRRPESVTGWYLVLPGLSWVANHLMFFVFSQRVEREAANRKQDSR